MNYLLKKIAIIMIRVLNIFDSNKTRVFDKLIFNLLKRNNKNILKNVDINLPKTLIKNFVESTSNSDRSIKNQLNSLLKENFSSKRWAKCEYSYNEIINRLKKRIVIFEYKPFQLGGLDIEIKVIAMLISQIKSPKILEIGVANGYSSAVIYTILDIVKGSMVSIDLPKYPVNSDYTKVLNYLIKRGLRDETGTIGDLIPGGIIPKSKYSGWLIPERLRFSVDNLNYFGDVFNILPKLNNNYFNIVVYDAMKPYEDRMQCFQIINQKLKDGGVCFVDGYWLNNAFIDFCNSNGYHYEKFGRVGAFVKR